MQNINVTGISVKCFKINLSRLSQFLLVVFAILIHSGCSSQPAVTSFTTGGHTIYHLQPANVKSNGERAIISAAYDGFVLCHTQKGKLLWENQPGKGFPFDLAVADIDKDGLDESLVASSDGNLYAFDHTGKSLWTFKGHAPLYQVCVTNTISGSSLILTGGIERVLYALSPKGNVVSRFETNRVIRLIEAGNFLGDGRNYAAVSTAGRMSLHDLNDLKPVWDKPSDTYFSMEVYDIDTDGKDDMILSVSNSSEIKVIDSQGNSRQIITCSQIPKRPYKMNLLTHVKSESLKDEFLINLTGRHLMTLNRDGSCRNLLSGSYSFAGSSFDPETNTFLLGSEISGGDGIYLVRLDRKDWENDFMGIKPIGKIYQMEKNMAELLHQVESFKVPSYQKKPDKTMIVIEESPDWDFDEMQRHLLNQYLKPYSFKNISFVPYVYSHESIHHFKEYYDPGIKDPKLRALWENWHSGKGGGAIGKITPKEEILQFARDREKAGEEFFIYAGHGRVFGLDFYISRPTLEEMIELAPNTLKGFVFAELEDKNDYLEKDIREQLLPLADICYKHGMKIFLRNKNIFWNSNIYMDMFKPIMADERYREVFVPSMEETNSRNQSLSLAGRTGLWLTGRFNHMTGRAVTDNANYNRLWEWGQTKHLSHYLRALSLKRVMGADIFHINITTDNATELLPFYLMLEKGILPLPGKADILSLSDLTIGIKPDADPDFVKHGNNGHGMTLYNPDEGQFVFDKLDCYWGGAMIPDHDFENYAMNAKRRMTNFIAQSPYGNMSSISAETDLSQFPVFKKMIVTDGRFWYDEEGNQHTAQAYKPVVVKALEEAADRLPIRVKGDVAWVALRIDPAHIRLIMIDPGYLDPADREAEVIFQHIEATEITDILSGENLQVKNGKLNIKVPLGILRVIDIRHI